MLKFHTSEQGIMTKQLFLHLFNFLNLLSLFGDSVCCELNLVNQAHVSLSFFGLLIEHSRQFFSLLIEDSRQSQLNQFSTPLDALFYFYVNDTNSPR